ncbi:MAG: hypothetical protein WCW40_00675 [Bacteroidota bacterium]
MFTTMDSETLWLTITNVGLGLVTVVCIIAVGVVIAKEVFADVRSKVRVPHLQDDHSFMLDDLGITMADGGKRIDEKERAAQYSADDNNESNIQRSEN